MAVFERGKDIYVATERWRDACLLGEGSILSDERLWNRKGFEDLVEYYVENPDEGEGGFFSKLQGQLRSAPKGAVKLLAEVFWILYLYVSRKAMTKNTKHSQIRRIWEWSGDELPEKAEGQLAYFDDGIGHPGTGFFTHRWRELKWFILAMHEWFGKPLQDRKVLLSQPWDFAQWLEATPESRGRQFRHILLHLLFPVEFERVSTSSHKRQILKKLAAPADGVPVNVDPSDRVAVDKALFALRRELEQQYGTDLDFYDTEISEQWAQPSQTTPLIKYGEAVGRRAGSLVSGTFWILSRLDDQPRPGGTALGGVQATEPYRDRVGLSWRSSRILLKRGNRRVPQDRERNGTTKMERRACML